jgi:Tfp pilus assembly protein PilV
MRRTLTTAFLLVAACAGVAASARPASATLYDVKFRLTQSVTVEALQFSVNYTAAGGEFVGSGADVECVSNSAINAIAAFNDVEATDTLHSSLIKTSGIAGAVLVVTCTFDAASKPAKSDFVVTVVDWYPAVSPNPTVSCSGVSEQ